MTLERQSMTTTEYGSFIQNTVSKRAQSLSPGKIIENYVYLYHLPGEADS
jgi:hypothetical protein